MGVASLKSLRDHDTVGDRLGGYSLARRATGTGVDPNAFGGFLMLVLVLAVGQAMAARPVVPRRLAVVTVPRFMPAGALKLPPCGPSTTLLARGGGVSNSARRARA